MTDQAPGVRPVGERLLFAARQAGLLAVALLVAGLVTERARPDELIDRGLATPPFLWAIVLWFLVLTFGALAFETPQTQTLESLPLYVGVVAGAIVFVVGLVNLDGGSTTQRVIYAFANAAGAVMFWWALFALLKLVILRLS